MNQRLKSWLSRHLGLLVITLSALAVRLYWNLRVHNPLDFAYSDMGGYLGRADQMLTGPWKPQPWFSLFPYGTHLFLFAVKWLFGKENKIAIGTSYAILGTIAVAFTFLIAKRYTKRPILPYVIGAFLVIYYPWISMGGYALSEIPFAACLAPAVYLSFRLVDHGKARDAWLLGLFLGLGCIVRSQMVVSVAFFGLLWLLRRRAFPNVTRGHLVRVAIPLGILLAISSARLYWHTGQIGLVSTNGPLNYAFGRCHCTGLESRAKDGRGFFGPPPFGALRSYEKEHPDPLFRLDPAMGETVRFQGHMWEPKPNYEVAHKCVEATGYWRQFKYGVTHVVLLWGYNFPWPDQGQKPQFRRPMMIWNAAHGIALLPPAAVFFFLAFRRRRTRTMMIALHLWALMLTAVLYFGDARLRTPYDGLIVILAFEGYAVVLRGVGRRLLALGGGGKVKPPAPAPAPALSSAIEASPQ